MRRPTSIARHLVTVMAILIATAAAAAAVRLGLMPDNPDPFVLGSLVVIFLIGTGTALYTFRHATLLETLVAEIHRLTATNTPAEPATSTDDLGRLAESLRSIGRKLRRTKLNRNELYRVSDTLNDAVILTDKDGAIKHVNRAAI